MCRFLCDNSLVPLYSRLGILEKYKSSWWSSEFPFMIIKLLWKEAGIRFDEKHHRNVSLIALFVIFETIEFETNPTICIEDFVYCTIFKPYTKEVLIINKSRDTNNTNKLLLMKAKKWLWIVKQFFVIIAILILLFNFNN